MEPGEGGKGGEQEAKAPAKEAASSDQATTSDPEPKKEENPKQEQPKKDTPPAPKEEKAPPPPKQESKPAPPPKSEEKPASKKDEKKPEPSPFGAGSRGENRVNHHTADSSKELRLHSAGENEPYAPKNSRATQAVTKYCRFAHDV